MYQGGFDIEYPVNVGQWAIVVDAFVSIDRFLYNIYYLQLNLCVYIGLYIKLRTFKRHLKYLLVFFILFNVMH